MMSLLLSIPDDIAASAQTMALYSGKTPESLLMDALRAHFPLIPPELQEEFDALELASDEDALLFEQRLAEETP